MLGMMQDLLTVMKGVSETLSALNATNTAAHQDIVSKIKQMESEQNAIVQSVEHMQETQVDMLRGYCQLEIQAPTSGPETRAG